MRDDEHRPPVPMECSDDDAAPPPGSPEDYGFNPETGEIEHAPEMEHATAPDAPETLQKFGNWHRCYNDVILSSALKKLDSKAFKTFIQICALVSNGETKAGGRKSDGQVPPPDELKFEVGTSEGLARRHYDALVNLGLLRYDEDEKAFFLVDWIKRQSPSPGAARVFEHRQRRRG